jgi:hypothetical protein
MSPCRCMSRGCSKYVMSPCRCMSRGCSRSEYRWTWSWSAWKFNLAFPKTRRSEGSETLHETWTVKAPNLRCRGGEHFGEDC